jgi:hypothetical protein
MAYTDLFNEALDDLSTTLTTITGLRVVTDPKAINPPCAFIEAPSFEGGNYNIVRMTFPVRVIGSGPVDLNGLRVLLSIAAGLLTKNVAVLDGRPSTLNVGGQDYGTYDLTIAMQAQTGAS